MNVTEKILVVDDDENLLKAIVRNLHKEFEITTVPSAIPAMQLLLKEGPFAVVVSDMRMPAMTGVEFLAKVKSMEPDTVRIMLTGNADMDTAIEAVNEGQIFRFLQKPCRAEKLGQSIRDALELYKLRKTEQQLLEETVKGSVKVLVELLGLVSPLAFSKAERMARTIRYLVVELNITDPWEFEVAALLSQLGSVTLAPEVLEKEANGLPLEKGEKQQLKQSLHLCRELIKNIPRLEKISVMIDKHQQPVEEAQDFKNLNAADRTLLGTMLLRVAAEFDRLSGSTDSHSKLVETLKQSAVSFPDEILRALKTYSSEQVKRETQLVTLDKLKKNSLLQGPIYAANGSLLAAQGQEVTDVMLRRLNAFADNVGVKEPIRIAAS